MKRLFLSVFFILSFVAAQSQQALLKFKSGTTQEAFITDIDSLYLTTSKGIFELSTLQEVVFSRKRGKDVKVYYELGDADVAVIFDENIVLTALEPPASASDFETRFKQNFQKYRKQHQIGAGLQFAGVLLAAVGILTEDQSFTYGGAALAGAGLVIEIGAGKGEKWE